jgi:hypothetical protein
LTGVWKGDFGEVGAKLGTVFFFMLKNGKAIQFLARRQKQKGKKRTELQRDWRHDRRSIDCRCDRLEILNHVCRSSILANSSNTYIQSYTGRRGSIKKDGGCLITLALAQINISNFGEYRSVLTEGK